MEDLGNRLQTFVDWPQHVAVKPKHLAEAGFYYVGEGPNDDTVCCFACHGKLNRWKAGDVPEVKHRERLGEICPFVQGMNVLGANASVNDRREIYDSINDDVMENEQQRLRSFQRNNGWPSAVDPRKLAAAGFYFTGVGDHVKCFACDVCLSQWQAEDDPISEHLKNQSNQSDCLFLSRLISGVSDNPKETKVYQYSQPNYMETINITNNKPHLVPGQLAFRSCGVILPEQNHTQTGPRRGLASEAMGPQRQGVSGLVPPNYANEHARLHSFINWPKECPVRPKELIDAGFYYTGEEDKAQCFKCDVILAGWEPEDTPWGEHERWSNKCPLVKERLLRRKSPHSSLCENTESSRVPKEQSWLPPKEDFSGQSVNSGPCESGYLGDLTKPSRLPKEQGESEALQDLSISKKKLETTGEVFHIQKAVHELLERGYDFETIEEAIQHKQKVRGETIDSIDDLRDAISMFMGMKSTRHPKENEHARADEHTESLPDPKLGKSSEDSHAVSEVAATGMSLSVDPETVHQQFERMQEVHMCSICFDAETGVVFLPCGHLVCCPKCAAEIQSKPSPLCPVCRTRIENTIQIYFS